MDKADKELNIRQKRFVKAKIEGKSNLKAYEEAGYSVKNKLSAKSEATKLKGKPHIQKAIDEALAFHGLTPEYAVGQLAKIVEQDKEVGAKRLAIKDVLELHGWNKADRPTLQLSVKNAFFGEGRKVIDVETSNPSEE